MSRAAPRLSIREILHPRSVAVFGASDNRDKFGGRIMYFLTKHRFGGRIVPINPRRSEVFGHKAYPAIGQSPDKVDVTILAVPTSELVGSIAQCADAGVGCCVIMTTGFAEASAEGAARQEEIVAIGRKSGMRIIGPNCMGFINPAFHLTLCSSVVLDTERLLVGKIGLASQSGALMVSMFDRAYGEGIGFSACVSMGNQSDLELCDFIEYMVDDPATRVICVYVEGFVDAARFMRAAAASRAAGKPMIVLKTGRTHAARGIDEAFDIHADHAGRGILDHVLDEIAELEVALIAERDAGAEADAVAIGTIEHRDHQRAALAHESDLADQQPLGIEHHRRAERQMVCRVQEPHAIGPDDPHAGAPADRGDLLLPRRALGARLGKSRGHDH